MTSPQAQLIELDPRRRTTVKPGRHSRYLVDEEPDGTLIWRPAVVVSEEEVKLLQRPDILDAVERSRARAQAGDQGAPPPVRPKRSVQN